MNLTIQSSFEAYVWAALWQAALGGLQAGGQPFNPKLESDDWRSRVQCAISLMGSAVSWFAWGLGVWVAMHVGVLAGIVFTLFSLAVNVITIIELQRRRPNPVVVQALSFVVMPIFAAKTLSALGVFG